MSEQNFKIGDLVKVGPAYVGDTYSYEDGWAGRVMRVVDLDSSDAGMCDLGLSVPTKEDAQVWINLRRLTKI